MLKCAICLLSHMNNRAETIVNGTAICEHHLKVVGAYDLGPTTRMFRSATVQRANIDRRSTHQ